MQQFAPSLQRVNLQVSNSIVLPPKLKMAVITSPACHCRYLFLVLLCGNLLNAARIVRMTSGDDGMWIDDTNTRLVMGEDEQSQATGLTGKHGN